LAERWCPWYLGWHEKGIAIPTEARAHAPVVNRSTYRPPPMSLGRETSLGTPAPETARGKWMCQQKPAIPRGELERSGGSAGVSGEGRSERANFARPECSAIVSVSQYKGHRAWKIAPLNSGLRSSARCHTLSWRFHVERGVGYRPGWIRSLRRDTHFDRSAQIGCRWFMGRPDAAVIYRSMKPAVARPRLARERLPPRSSHTKRAYHHRDDAWRRQPIN